MLSFLLAAIAITIPAVQPGVPNRQPALAAESNYAALVFGSGNSIWYTHSDGKVTSFSKPIRIADVPGLMLGRHRGPRIAAHAKELVVTAVQGGDNGNLLAWRSRDEGRTWSMSPVVVNDQPRAAREGLQNLAVDKDGTFAAVWLDLRAQGTRLYGAYSSDGGKTWSPNVPLYANTGGTICQCCHPSIAVSTDGKFEVMFRNVVNGDRDMYAMAWIPGKTLPQPEKQGTGTWELNACPMDGGSIAASSGGVVSAWRRDHQVMLAEKGQSERAVGQGKDVALATTPEGAAVAFVEPGGAVALALPNQQVRTIANQGAYPALGALDGKLLAAWEDGDTIAARLVAP